MKSYICRYIQTNLTALKYLTLASAQITFSGAAVASSETEEESKFNAKPLSESDMGNVSAVAGFNLLNVYGAPEAGLRVDDDSRGASSNGSSALPMESSNLDSIDTASNSSDDSEGTSSLQASTELSRVSSDQSENNVIISTTANGDVAEESDLQAAIDETDVKIGNAEVFTTSSEIVYRKNNFTHKLTPNKNGSVTLTRDLHIEELRIENLGGDHHDHTRTVGDIILSDWRSRGDTTVTVR